MGFRGCGFGGLGVSGLGVLGFRAAVPAASLEVAQWQIFGPLTGQVSASGIDNAITLSS